MNDIERKKYNEYMKNWYRRNKERINLERRNEYKDNPEKRKKILEQGNKWRKENKYNEKYYLKNREKEIKRAIKWINKNPDKFKQNKKRYYERSKQKRYEKIRIHNWAYTFLRDTMLERDNHKCTKCSSKRKLEMHELVYVYPQKLENLMTLCTKCHGKIHRK